MTITKTGMHLGEKYAVYDCDSVLRFLSNSSHNIRNVKNNTRFYIFKQSTVSIKLHYIVSVNQFIVGFIVLHQTRFWNAPLLTGVQQERKVSI